MSYDLLELDFILPISVGSLYCTDLITRIILLLQLLLIIARSFFATVMFTGSLTFIPGIHTIVKYSTNESEIWINV